MANYLSLCNELRSTIKDPKVPSSEKVKRLACLRGITMADLAELCNMHYVTLFKTIHGTRPNRVRKNNIAKALGVPVSDIWPDYFDEA